MPIYFIKNCCSDLKDYKKKININKNNKLFNGSIDFPWLILDKPLPDLQNIKIETDKNIHKIDIEEYDLPKPNKKWNYKLIKSSKYCRTLIFCRHGHYYDNAPYNLTIIGKKEIKQTGKYLKTLLDKNYINPINCIYYSNLLRAKESFNIIDEELNNSYNYYTKEEPLLAECYPISNYPNKIPDLYESELEEYKDNYQMESFFKKYIQSDDFILKKNYSSLFVCHGNVIRYILLRTMQLDVSAWLRFYLRNGSLTFINIFPNGDIRVDGIGERGFFINK